VPHAPLLRVEIYTPTLGVHNCVARFEVEFPGAPLSGFRKWERMKFKAFDLALNSTVLTHFPK
jgi:hypothetical protein